LDDAVANRVHVPLDLAVLNDGGRDLPVDLIRLRDDRPIVGLKRAASHYVGQ